MLLNPEKYDPGRGLEQGETVDTELWRGCSLTKTSGSHLQHHDPFGGVHLIYATRNLCEILDKLLNSPGLSLLIF